MDNEFYKFKFSKIAQRMIVREFENMEDDVSAISMKFLELKNNKEGRQYLRDNINGLINIFNDALKELDLADEEDKEVSDG